MTKNPPSDDEDAKSTRDGTNNNNNNKSSGKSNKGYNKGWKGKNNKGNKKSRRNNPFKTPKSFKGATSELNGHVFEVHSEQPKQNQFQRTIEEFLVFSSREYKELGMHLATLVNTLTTPVATEPEELPATATAMQQ